MKNIPALNTLDEMIAQAVVYTDTRFKLNILESYSPGKAYRGDRFENWAMKSAIR
jgi:hypothetical protein